MTPNGLGHPKLEEKQKNRRILADHLYTVMRVGVESEMSSGELANGTGITASQASDISRSLEELGIIKRYYRFGAVSKGEYPGRHYMWTVLVDRDEAFRRLEKGEIEEAEHLIESRRAGAVKSAAARKGVPQGRVGVDVTPARLIHETAEAHPPVTIAPEESHEETRAIAGPEPDAAEAWSALASLRKRGDAEALIEATRQYRSRKVKVEMKVRELQTLAEEMGVTGFDPALILDSLQFKTDPLMEIVAELIPYIDRLEARVKSLGEQAVISRQKVTDYDRLAAENKRLSDRVRALVSERAQMVQRS